MSANCHRIYKPSFRPLSDSTSRRKAKGHRLQPERAERRLPCCKYRLSRVGSPFWHTLPVQMEIRLSPRDMLVLPSRALRSAELSSNRTSDRLNANRRKSFPRTFLTPHQTPNWRGSGPGERPEIFNPAKSEARLRGSAKLHAPSGYERSAHHRRSHGH